MQFIDVRDNLRMHTKWKQRKKNLYSFKVVGKKLNEMKWKIVNCVCVCVCALLIVDEEGIGMIR